MKKALKVVVVSVLMLVTAVITHEVTLYQVGDQALMFSGNKRVGPMDRESESLIRWQARVMAWDIKQRRWLFRSLGLDEYRGLESLSQYPSREAAVKTAELDSTGAQPAPRYLVTYVYHTKENGPVAGYGYAEVDNIDNLDQLHTDLMEGEMDLWKRMGKPGHMLSMSFISINKL